MWPPEYLHASYDITTLISKFGIQALLRLLTEMKQIRDTVQLPTVSIIIPTYKHQDFVLATLDSVFAQTFTDYEVIVINDGSPDDTAALLRPLADAGRIRYIEQKNQGQSAARNRGIAEAQGEFIALLDDDDLWPPDKLEWQVQALRENAEAVMVYGDALFVEPQFCLGAAEEFVEKERFLHPNKDSSVGWAYEEFLLRNPTASPGQTLILATAVKQVQGFDEAIWGADDYDLYLRLSKMGSFIYERRLALYYRQHASNASQQFFRHYKNICTVHRKHLGRYPFSSDNRLWLSAHRHYRSSFLGAMLNELHVCIQTGDKAKGEKIWRWMMLMPPDLSLLKYMFDLLWALKRIRTT